MPQAHIQDRVRWGLNVAARRLGDSADAFRPSGPFSPLRPENRFLKLPALFSGLHGGFKRPNPFGAALCDGFFDAADTRPGDYLVQGGSTWFIASQEPFLPVLCVRTNRVVSFHRPEGPSSLGPNLYGGVVGEGLRLLLGAWPANVLGAIASARAEAGLPADGDGGRWTVLLPTTAPSHLVPGDLMSDDLGQTAVVCGCEQSDLGWRVDVKQVSL